jgi:YidC/Oxa1 family membrane protein insertase
LYLQLARDGNPPEGEIAPFYFTFTGPALYTEAKQVPEGRLQGHRARRNASHETSRQRRLDRHGAALLRIGLAAAAPGAARVPHRQGGRQPLHHGDGAAAGRGGARARARRIEARLFAGPQEENKLAALAPGLELVKDYGWFTVLAKPLFWLLDKLHGVIGNWGWAIVALVVLLKIAFYWLNASAYRSMAKMKAVAPARDTSCASATRTSRSRCSRR